MEMVSEVPVINLPAAPVTRVLTNSSISTFQECREKYRLAYIELLRTERQPDYFRIGGAYHLGQEILAKTGSLTAALEAIRQNYENPPEWVTRDPDTERKWVYEAVTCMTLLKGYVEYYSGGIPDRYPPAYPPAIAEVIEAESVFLVPIRNPETGATTPRYQRSGKMDQIVRLVDGRVALLEFKLLGQDIQPGSEIWWKYKIDSQPSGYFVACVEKNQPIHLVMYGLTRKPTIRPEQVDLRDEDGIKIVLDSAGNRVQNKDGKSWRQTGDSKAGYVLQSRPQEPEEWGEKLLTDIRNRPEFYYVRGEVTRFDSDLLDYETDLWQIQKDMAEAEKSGRFYKNTRACISRTTCPYFKICTQRIPVGAGHDIPEGFRRAESAHEELEEA